MIGGATWGLPGKELANSNCCWLFPPTLMCGAEWGGGGGDGGHLEINNDEVMWCGLVEVEVHELEFACRHAPVCHQSNPPLSISFPPFATALMRNTLVEKPRLADKLTTSIQSDTNSLTDRTLTVAAPSRYMYSAT